MGEPGPHEPMTDDWGRRLIKALLRWLFLLELRARRRLMRFRGQDHYRLAGSCQACAKCCEQPTLALPRFVFKIAALRALVLAWQWHVNRFAFVEADEDAHTVSFRCGHFDWTARRCDSYDSRPAVCRDYPRFLLDQPWPELFDQCGYRAVYRHASGLAKALDATDLSPDQRAELKRRLKVLE